MKWIAKTSGEELFLAIRDIAIPSMSAMEASWNELQEFLASVSGNSRYSLYFRGAMAITAMRRLLRFWADVESFVGSEGQRIRVVSDFMREEVFPGLERFVTTRLARLVIEATAVTGRPISAAMRRRVLQGKTTANCYLCGFALTSAVSMTDANFLTLEHLWPSSAGGDSIDDNLLPACIRCQDDKADALSWEWLNVHNLVLPSEPSARALTSVPRPSRVARHYLQVMELCEERKYTLKRGFIVAGPMSGTLTCSPTGSPITFFDLRT